MADGLTVALVGVASGVVSALLSGNLSVEVYKRRAANQDKEKTQRDVFTEAQIVDRQLYEERLIAQIEKLTQAERALIDERIEINRKVALLEAKIESLTKELDESDEEIKKRLREITSLNAVVESRNTQIGNLQRIIEDLHRQVEKLQPEVGQ